MLFLLTNRETLIEFLPKNGIGAEIGVAHGDFSEQLLTKTSPRTLHLIDATKFPPSGGPSTLYHAVTFGAAL